MLLTSCGFFAIIYVCCRHRLHRQDVRRISPQKAPSATSSEATGRSPAKTAGLTAAKSQTTFGMRALRQCRPVRIGLEKWEVLMKASEFETAGIIARTAELEMALIHQYLAGHPYDELTTTREESAPDLAGGSVVRRAPAGRNEGQGTVREHAARPVRIDDVSLPSPASRFPGLLLHRCDPEGSAFRGAAMPPISPGQFVGARHVASDSPRPGYQYENDPDQRIAATAVTAVEAELVSNALENNPLELVAVYVLLALAFLFATPG